MHSISEPEAFWKQCTCSSNCLSDITYTGYTGAKGSYTIYSNTHHTHVLLTKLCAGMLRVAGNTQAVWRIARPSSWWSRTVLQTAWLTLNNVTHYNPFQHHKLFIWQHGITLQHTWSFGSTTICTSKFARSMMLTASINFFVLCHSKNYH
jgi:hypothetical protein